MLPTLIVQLPTKYMRNNYSFGKSWRIQDWSNSHLRYVPELCLFDGLHNMLVSVGQAFVHVNASRE